MSWLALQMWFLLALAFVWGLIMHRWISGGGRGPLTEDVSAELASARTRLQDSEADRVKLKKRAAELGLEADRAARDKDAALARAAELEAELAKRESDAATVNALRARINALEKDAAAAADLRRALSGVEGEAKAAAELRRRLEAAESALAQARQAPDISQEAAQLRKRIAELEGALKDAAGQVAAPAAPPASGGAFLAEPSLGAPDDLKKIRGVGPKLEKMLNELGVFYYRQIAGWSADDVAEVDAKLAQFPGRILRDGWVEQAKGLAGERKGG